MTNKELIEITEEHAYDQDKILFLEISKCYSSIKNKQEFIVETTEEIKKLQKRRNTLSQMKDKIERETEREIKAMEEQNE